MHTAALNQCSEALFKNPLTTTAKLAIGIGVAALAGVALAGSIAWASSATDKRRSPALPRQLLLSSADTGKSFAVKPGTVIYITLPGTGWDGMLDQGGRADTAVQFGEGSGPHPYPGGEGFVVQAVFPGVSVLSFTNKQTGGGTIQFTFVVAPSM